MNGDPDSSADDRLPQRHPLIDAAMFFDANAVDALLAAGADPQVADERGFTTLHAAAWMGDGDGDEENERTGRIIESLLRAGADPNARDAHGDTPMHEALSGDGLNLVAAEQLLAAGADINATNDDDQTPLHISYETLFEYERVVPFMLERGANPLLRDKWGQTVIDIARRMIAGANPRWRIEQCEPEGGPPCGWKEPAKPGDSEYRMLELLEEAAMRFK